MMFDRWVCSANCEQDYTEMMLSMLYDFDYIVVVHSLIFINKIHFFQVILNTCLHCIPKRRRSQRSLIELVICFWNFFSVLLSAHLSQSCSS